MAEKQRTRFGGQGDYSIYRIESLNSEGQVTSVKFEVVGPDNDHFDSFGTIDGAMRLVKALAGVEPEQDYY